MTFRLLVFSILIITVVFFSGCERQAPLCDCVYGDKTPVTAVQGPNSAAVNQEIKLVVSFITYNGCGQFARFDQTNSGNTTTVAVIANYSGCLCTMNVPTPQEEYKFIPTLAGTYEFKFEQAHGTFLTHTIVVQ